MVSSVTSNTGVLTQCMYSVTLSVKHSGGVQYGSRLSAVGG